MSISLYVTRTNGDAEVLDDVSEAMAGDIFSKLDWTSDLAAVSAAMEEGKDVFFPEFGLTEDAESTRTLTISPVDSSNVAFRLVHAHAHSDAEYFPKDQVIALINQFFLGEDNAIAALCAKAPSVAVTIRELTEPEFQATFTKPMHRLKDEVTYRPVPLQGYLSECITENALPSPLEALEIDSIYLAHDKRHSHILFEYGDPTAQLVIVVSHDPETEIDAVLGHYFLDLSEDRYSA